MNHTVGGGPATKAARHAAIVEILATNQIASQEQLREQLSARGIDTAQATLSRDLLELQAAKVRTSEGILIYSVMDADGAPTHMADSAGVRLARWCQDLLVTGDLAQNIVVLRTPVGAANLLASAIDAARLEGVVGSVAGDDTIFVACRSGKDAAHVLQTVLGLAAGSSLGV